MEYREPLLQKKNCTILQNDIRYKNAVGRGPCVEGANCPNCSPPPSGRPCVRHQKSDSQYAITSLSLKSGVNNFPTSKLNVSFRQLTKVHRLHIQLHAEHPIRLLFHVRLKRKAFVRTECRNSVLLGYTSNAPKLIQEKYLIQSI
jgi:hypothetical protein